MRRYILYPHGGSGNHGCEAIVRATSIILDGDIRLFSNRIEDDIKYGLESVCKIMSPIKPIKKDFRYFVAQCKRLLLRRKNALDSWAYGGIINNVRKGDVFLSIGGDNYCYGINEHILLVNAEIRKRRVPTVLWGCSVEPDALNGRTLEDLQKFDCIIARESLTYDALKAKGVKRVELCPDPAFILPVGKPLLPKGFIEGNTVGVNISPMIYSYSGDKGSLLLENYFSLIDYILSETNMSVAFIPHVVWDFNDDRKAIDLLYSRYRENDRVCVVEDQNAEQLKGVISKCRFLVTARTHASIAGYSTGVPTLVMGYSIKAKGIAKDLFGEYDKYVKPVQCLVDTNDVKKSFVYLLNKEDEIKLILRKKIPEYKQLTMKMGDIMNSLN